MSAASPKDRTAPGSGRPHQKGVDSPKVNKPGLVVPTHTSARKSKQIRFGMVSLPSSWIIAKKHAELAEKGGFDCLWVGDHLTGRFLDGWSLVAAWATVTQKIRIGVLVTNMIYRSPSLLAKQVAAVAEISGGRLELGLGAGEVRADHEAAGIPYWEPKERLARFKEFVEAASGLLGGDITEYCGRYYHFGGVEPHPCPVNRPPLTVAAYGPAATKVAVRHADTWNTFCGGLNLNEESLVAMAALRLRMADRKCDEVGRDPSTLRKSVLVPPQHRPWASVENLLATVERYVSVGFDELVFFAPEETEMLKETSEVLERARSNAPLCEHEPWPRGPDAI